MRARNARRHVAAGQSRFYLVEPRPGMDAAALAERLIARDSVREVFLTEGRYGFVVRVVAGPSGDGPLLRCIARSANCRVDAVTSHYRYGK